MVDPSARSIEQLVDDLHAELMQILGGLDALAVAPRTGIDHHIGELRARTERASGVVGELRRAVQPLPRPRPPTDLNGVVVSTLPALSSLVGAANLRFDLRLSMEPVPVAAHGIELERILLNVVLNIIGRMERKGVFLIETAVLLNPAYQGVKLRGRYGQLRVTEFGHDLASEDQSRPYEPFFNGQQTGTGAAWSSVVWTVDQLQGRVFAMSDDAATSISIVLPLIAGL